MSSLRDAFFKFNQIKRLRLDMKANSCPLNNYFYLLFHILDTQLPNALFRVRDADPMILRDDMVLDALKE